MSEKVLLILIHGRGSSAAKSNTVNSLKNHFGSKEGYEIMTPSYDSDKSHDELASTFDALSNKIHWNHSDADTVVVIGTSLGGYWGKYLANRISGAKFIGLNPSFHFYPEGVRDLEDRKDLPVAVYCALDDDVVDPRIALDLYGERGKAVPIASGGHRLLSVLPEYFEDIEFDINTLAG